MVLNENQLSIYAEGEAMKKSISVALGVVSLVLFLVSPIFALDLTGTIRDFTPQTNPDFEAAIVGLTTGIVQSTLGADGKPVYAHGTSSYGSVTDETTFYDWYHDGTYGVDKADYTLTLTETSPGIYTYESSSFFPIDGQLLGNYGAYNHNYHFTYEIHTTFTYQTGQTFSFTGDDDVWVFIDNELVVDLGGIHSAANDSVDLDTLGLTVGNTYDFDFFFAERHTTESNLKIETSIALNNNVPEPCTILLVGLGLVGVAGVRRFRK